MLKPNNVISIKPMIILENRCILTFSLKSVNNTPYDRHVKFH